MTFTTPLHTNEQGIDRVLGTGLPVLLVFWRKECPPCQQLNPTLDTLASIYAGKVLVAKVDVQDNPALVRRYSVSQLPELIVMRDKSEVSRAYGAPIEASLRAWLDGLLSGNPRPAPPHGPSEPLSGAVAAEPRPRSSAPESNIYHTRTGNGPRPVHASEGGPIILTDVTFDQVVGRSDMPVLVDFWAPWCGPCRAVAPTVERMAQEFAGRVVVAKLNVDENQRTAQRFGISSIPALYLFKRGQVVERLVGVQPASVLRQVLARHVGRT